MKIDIQADIPDTAGANAADVRLAVAIQFYADNRIDHADACQLAEVTPPEFNKELLARGIGMMQYPLVASTAAADETQAEEHKPAASAVSNPGTLSVPPRCEMRSLLGAQPFYVGLRRPEYYNGLILSFSFILFVFSAKE